MASDPDDNPFARPSVWPRMPQAPMSIRTLSGAERSEPEPPPATTNKSILMGILNYKLRNSDQEHVFKKNNWHVCATLNCKSLISRLPKSLHICVAHA